MAITSKHLNFSDRSCISPISRFGQQVPASLSNLFWCIEPPTPVLPFEFILPGRPVSNQTKDKSRLRAWQTKVRQVATRLWASDRPYEDFVHIQLTYYFEAPDGKEDTVPDSDNIVKPIREALKGVVYEHDYQVTDVVSRRRNLNSSFRVKGISPTLAEGFVLGLEFVHVKIENAPDPSDLS